MESKTLKILFIMFFCLFGQGAAHAQESNFEEPQVRVLLLKAVREAAVSIRGQYKLVDAKTNKVLQEGRALKKTMIKMSKGGFIIGDDYIPVKQLRITTDKDITVFANHKSSRYRFQIDFVPVKESLFHVINPIGLEQYIKGVLYHEVDHRWPMETLKSQAVAARTYALYQMTRSRAIPYDVTSDIYSQVYGGRSAERYRTTLAVNRTKYEVLTYKGNIFPSYYSSMCAGHTENVRELWNENWPPMKGVVCNFDKDAPHNNWIRNFRSEDVQKKLNQHGYRLGAIKEIRVIEKNESGRNRMLLIETRDGQMVKITGKKFRDIIGPNVVKSNKYDVVMKGFYFDVIGKGWGHGVGMCQWGAQEMARQQYDYKQILGFYYPGAQLSNYNRLGIFAKEGISKNP